jgi:hypothetical protein
MTYPVGTHISFGGGSANPPRKPRLYVPGTRVLFPKFVPTFDVLSVHSAIA